jgi:small subunit ribosomal protein S5
MMRRRPAEPEFNIEDWTPKTKLGKRVKAGELASIKQLLERGEKILEPEIVDALLKGLETDYVFAGQAKGKFGGGKRRPVRQTQKKTAEGSRLSFTTIAVVGNKNGYVGVGIGKAGETMPSREKATKAARKNIIEVVRGCGSWECNCGETHSLPYAISGRCGSIRLKLMPAPKGTGLAVEGELKKILKLAGYKDVWSELRGQASQKRNLVEACMSALRAGTRMRISATQKKNMIVGDGIKREEVRPIKAKADKAKAGKTE